MKIFYDSKLISELSNSYLFFDTNSFIGAFLFPDLFEQLFSQLQAIDCQFITIPSVVFEFTRGTQTVEDFNKRAEFLQNLAVKYSIEKHLSEFEELTVVLQKIKGDIHFTDFLLIASLYKFQDSFLIKCKP